MWEIGLLAVDFALTSKTEGFDDSRKHEIPMGISRDNSVNYLCYHIGGTNVRERFRKLSFCGKPPFFCERIA